MNILINSEDVDFEYPVYMSDEQREKFIAFMQSLFPEIKVVETPEPERPGPKHNKSKKWSLDEYREVLLNPGNVEELVSKLGRSKEGIGMQIIAIVPKFNSWCRKKGYSKKTNETVEEFIKEIGV